MADPKTELEQKIKEMAKSGEFKEKLLGDSEFMVKTKEALKKEGIEADDAVIAKIVSEIQDYLSGKKEIPGDVLKNVSGGGVNAAELAVGVGHFTVLGAGVGAGIGGFLGNTAKGARIGAITGAFLKLTFMALQGSETSSI